MKPPKKPDFEYDPTATKGSKSLDIKKQPQSSLDSSPLDSDFVFEPNKDDIKKMPKTHQKDDFSDLQSKKKPLWKRIIKWFFIVLLIFFSKEEKHQRQGNVEGKTRPYTQCTLLIYCF